MTDSQPGLFPAELYAGYRPLANTFDEAFDAEGHPRPHWEALLRSLGSFPSSEWQERSEVLRRVQRDFGLPNPQNGGRASA